jgi:hypothetical protein
MSSPYEEFRKQKSNAKTRGIGFDLTYDQWWSVWKESGFYGRRGRRGFVMHRIDNDRGYAIDNVEIIHSVDNFRYGMEEHYGGERCY